jgi:hypothetical protein
MLRFDGKVAIVTGAGGGNKESNENNSKVHFKLTK